MLQERGDKGGQISSSGHEGIGSRGFLNIMGSKAERVGPDAGRLVDLVLKK